ncbi:MAG: carotenoid oxygenase family protein [Myxococcales bacterium]|nr:carotenoid oxygenase family protein [Myxococcales bacterium]
MIALDHTRKEAIMNTARHIQTAGTPLASSVIDGPFDGLARIEGTFPAWLRGRLVRTAPAVFEQDGWAAAHWFDALGQLSFHPGCKACRRRVRHACHARGLRGVGRYRRIEAWQGWRASRRSGRSMCSARCSWPSGSGWR